MRTTLFMVIVFNGPRGRYCTLACLMAGAAKGMLAADMYLVCFFTDGQFMETLCLLAPLEMMTCVDAL